MAARYEYKVYEVGKVEELEIRLNEAAREGWELDRLFLVQPWTGGWRNRQAVWAVLRRPVAGE